MTDRLLELAEKVEKAEGPSRELDAEIALATGWTFQPAVSMFYPWWSPAEKAETSPPWFTNSIDAALTLVPEGFAIRDWMIWPGQPSRVTLLGTRLERFGRQKTLERVHNHEYGRWTVEAPTAALALCAAALRARSRSLKEGG